MLAFAVAIASPGLVRKDIADHFRQCIRLLYDIVVRLLVGNPFLYEHFKSGGSPTRIGGEKAY